ncbi:MAG: hypothetical protein IPK19_38335 [Chloroflexi bacterium]|nr:hypothetical protein [Chloroflexota bacterium]
MTRKFQQTLIIALLGVGLTLLAAGLTPLLVAQAQEATAEPSAGATEEAPVLDLTAPSEAIEITGDNSYCLLCHAVPWRTKTLSDGTLLNLYVTADEIQNSVHGATAEHATVGCVDCHREMPFPHFLAPSASDDRSFTIDSVTMCVGCHLENAEELDRGRHAEAIRAGNRESAVCTDCHGAHDVAPVVEHQELVAGVCGDCHTATLAEFRASPHVSAGPLGCASCHSPHSQLPRVGTLEEPDALCLNCHEENLEELLVHQQHSDDEYPVGCVDCHMSTEQSAGQAVSVTSDQAVTGHSMHIATITCTTCHEDLVASGQWETLTASTTAAETGSTGMAEEVAEAEAEATTASGQTSVELIQGLILGLGFGVTFGAIFVARGNRARTQVGPEESSETDKSNEAH